jgi:hypothetical protein
MIQGITLCHPTNLKLTWNTTAIESGTYYILVTVTNTRHSASAYVEPIYLESRKSISFPGIIFTLLAIGLLVILLKGKKTR